MHKPIDPHRPEPGPPAERPNPDFDPPPVGDPLQQPLPGEPTEPGGDPGPEIKEPRPHLQGFLPGGWASPADAEERFPCLELYQ